LVVKGTDASVSTLVVRCLEFYEMVEEDESLVIVFS